MFHSMLITFLVRHINSYQYSQGWSQEGILGSRVEKLVANLAPSLMGSCPEVSLLGELVELRQVLNSVDSGFFGPTTRTGKPC